VKYSLPSTLRRPTDGEWAGLTAAIQRYVAIFLPLSAEKSRPVPAIGMGSIIVDGDDNCNGPRKITLMIFLFVFFYASSGASQQRHR
jgi:hypothetical protein